MTKITKSNSTFARISSFPLSTLYLLQTYCSQPPKRLKMPRVAYINSEALLSAADTLPSNIGRASLVHSLISSYKLLESDPSHENLNTASQDCIPPPTARIVESKPATERELLEFHDSQYVGQSYHRTFRYTYVYYHNTR